MTLPNAREMLSAHPLVPVLVIDDTERAVDAARALADGGIHAVEVTLRTPAALESIRRIAEAFTAEEMCVGAGTIINADQARAAIDAGAHFLVSPGFLREIIDVADAANVVCVPGVSNATGIMEALAAGIDTVKFFPAEASGGLPAIRALSGPFPQVKFMPTGGIGPKNLADYLAVGSVMSVGGSWMVTRSMVADGDWAAITAASKDASAAAKEARGE